LLSIHSEVRIQNWVEDESAIFNELASQIKERKLLEVYGSDATYFVYTEPLFDAVLIDAASMLEGGIPEKALEVLKPLADRDLLAEKSNTYNLLVQVSRLMVRIDAVQSRRFNSIKEFSDAYTKEWYSIDYHYRKACFFWKNCSQKDQYHTVWKLVNKQYDAFIDETNKEWLSSLNLSDFNLKKTGCTLQSDFFESYVKPTDVKTVVLVSDALRYEIAHELLQQLIKDPKATPELEYMLSVLPSRTFLGMASLLPHNEIVSDGK
jgi:hypothetical protein